MTTTVTLNNGGRVDGGPDSGRSLSLSTSASMWTVCPLKLPGDEGGPGDELGSAP